MFKRLAILGLFGAILFGWPRMADAYQPQTHADKKVGSNQQGNLPPSAFVGSKSNADKHDQTVPNGQKQNSPPDLPIWWKHPEWVNVEVTAAYTIISLFTLVILAVQVGLMRRTARRQLRAYVMAETGTIVNVANPDKSKGPKFKTGAELAHPEWGPIVKIQIKNTGQTPAHDVVHWAGIYHRELPLKSPLPPMPIEDKFNKSPIGPGIPITKVLFFGPPLTAEQIKSLKEGTAAIYCQGIIRYRDAFMKKRFTRYRLMHGIHGGRIGVNTDLTFCEDGNDTGDTQVPWWKLWRRKFKWKPKHSESKQYAEPKKAN
jgi:hypothetical protein